MTSRFPLPQRPRLWGVAVAHYCAWYVPFFSNTVDWRGYRARIGRNAEMIERAA